VTRFLEAAKTLLTSPELAVGWWCGLIALAVGLGTAFAWRSRRASEPVPVAGLLFAGAVMAALGWTLGLPAGLAIGLILLAGAGAGQGMGRRWLLTAPLAVSGGWLVVFSSGAALEGIGLRLLVATAMVLGGWLLADFDHRWRGRGLGPVLVAVSAGGIYATVPDTEQAMVALGVAAPLAVLGWPRPLAALGRGGAFAVSGVLLWVVAAGGAGRGSSVVGGVACLGLFAVEPLARHLHPGRRSVLDRLPKGRWGSLAAIAIHLGLVYLAARVAGLQPTVGQAVAITTAVLAVAVVLARVAGDAGARRGGHVDTEDEQGGISSRA
jgi:hypothetical protein